MENSKMGKTISASASRLIDIFLFRYNFEQANPGITPKERPD